MKEPIFECQNCGRELDVNQIGKYTWCTGCQMAWDAGFNEGIRTGRRLLELTGDLGDWLRVMEETLPYKVR